MNCNAVLPFTVEVNATIFPFQFFLKIFSSQFQLQLYPPKASSFHSEGELSGSYVSIECPSPPAPPVCITDVRRDPQVKIKIE